ncbi:MocR-like transcription factor YczR [Aeromicrobium massiliense]|uniref:MocR-like transcription factor YczR n=1 Tax=Aeromicrobium massiliense TaxID=1464554 RepID=UPI0005785EDF|nr:PLP-dependent aminotransferase family protein [Aeromicrobium massiliense]
MTSFVPASRLAALLGSEPLRSPAYADLAERVRLLVVDGRVADGARLPSERDLAVALGVSRTTTARVYAELRERGVLRSRRGSGSVVQVPPSESHVSSLITAPSAPGTIALTYSAPAGPPGLARAFAAAQEQLPALLATTGYLPDGLPVLREALAERYRRQGLPTDPEQVVVTNGAMGALSLAFRTFVSAGDRVVVEGLSYPHAYDAIVASGGRLAPLPVTEHPWDVQALAALLGSGRHATAYFIPDFHNPTAAVMDESTRAAWARLLRRHGVLPVVDESLREVNLDRVELPPSYATYDPRAVLVGSASKEFWGGLRIGWARLPRHLVTPVLQRRMTLDLGSSAFEQLVLAHLLQGDGADADHRRETARTARDHLLAELAVQLPMLAAEPPAGGLNVWAELPERVSTPLVAAAERHGLLLTPGPRFHAHAGGETRLRLPYTQGEAVITEAVRRLRDAWDEVTSRAGRPAAAGRAPIDLIA